VSLVALEIPKVGLVMESARLVRWLKNVGDVVKQGEPLLELETEKSIVEIESTESGRLVEILLQVDQEARVGDRVAWLENDPNGAAAGASGASAPSSRGTGTAGVQVLAGASGASARGHASGGASAAVASHEVSSRGAGIAVGSARHTSSGATEAPTSAALAGANQHGASGRIKSSPVARRLAAEHSIDLGQVAPTGPRGRVQLSDVRREIEARGEQRGPSAQAQASTSMGPQARAMAATGAQPLSSMRRAVARSMTLSNATIPQFIVERAVDWTTLHAIRAKVTAELPSGAAKPSVNDFLLQAIARTLLAFPQLNATFTGDANSSDAALLPATGTHIGLVVAVENGLLVPVLHDVDRIGIVELARRRNETVQRATSGKLKREELEGATFSLSNLGARGPDRFTAIISPPQSAILAVGRQRDCVVAINGGIHVRPMSQLALTVDHRVADGRLAADFLAALVETLEGNHWRLN
jgi:pyruvate dehydrogenase E2 component (dihydrolipoamide acetyltransferase)